MRVPSAQKTIAYFDSLGYRVKPVKLSPGVGGWKISGKDCPLDGRTFYTRLELWAEWLDYAAERIHQAALIDSIMHLLAKAEDQTRGELISELCRWKSGERSDLFSRMSVEAPGGNSDNLPKSWKFHIKKYLSSKKGRLRFWGDLERSLLEAGYTQP